MKLKYDVTESDPESALAAGSFEKPLPGLYRFSIKEVNAGHTKGDDGKPDKTKPRVEVVFACDDSRYRNAQVWAYFVQKGHPSYDKGAAEKWDQLLLALGISQKKRTGEIDTEKQMINKFVTVRVRGGKDQSGDYRAEYGSVFPDGHAGVATDTPDDEELIDESESSDDEEVLADDEDWDARHAELSGADVPTLKDIAKEYGIKITGMKKSELVDALIEYEKALTSDGSSEDEEIVEDDEVIEDDSEPTIYLTREGLTAMEIPDLVAAAKDFDIVTKGKKKSEVINEILAAQAAPDDDALPF